MKAKEAPKKIWMSDDTEAIWVTNPYSTRFIEYTRTDAFIEKARKYIANHFLAPGMDNEINDFVNYMKGE